MTPGTSGILAHWRFDEQAGASTAGEPINSLNAQLTASGAAFQNGGLSGNALRIVRSLNGAAVVGDHFALDQGAYTFSIWIKLTPNDQTRDLTVFSKHSTGSANGFYLSANASGSVPLPNGRTLFFSGNDGTVTSFSHPFSSTSINDGNWHHIVITHDLGGNRILYVDGLPAEANHAVDPYVASSAPFVIGSSTQSGNRAFSFDGLIDDFQIYNRVITDAEISFLSGNPGQSIPAVLPPTITTHAINTLADLNGAAIFDVTASGSGTFTYQWLRNGSSIPNATNATLVLSGLTSTDAGHYSVMITNPGGVAVSQSARLLLAQAQGLLAHWNFNETGGASTATERINSLDATLSANGAEFAEGGIDGKSLRITRASTGAAVVGDHFDLGTNDWTISVWIKTAANESGSDLSVFTKHNTGSANGYWLVVNTVGSGISTGDAVFFSGDNGVVSSTSHPVSITKVNDGQWHHVLITHGHNGRRRLYVDGLPLEADLPTTTYLPSTAPFVIGSSTTAGARSHSFNGDIDEFQIYKRILTDTEISYLKDNPGSALPIPQAPYLDSQPKSLVSTIGGQAVFTVNAIGSPPLQYQWHRLPDKPRPPSR